MIAVVIVVLIVLVVVVLFVVLVRSDALRSDECAAANVDSGVAEQRLSRRLRHVAFCTASERHSACQKHTDLTARFLFIDSPRLENYSYIHNVRNPAL